MNAVAVTPYSRVTMNVDIVVLNRQKCNQCLKVHKSLGLLFGGVHNGHKSLGCSHGHCQCLFWSGYVSSSLLSDVSKVKSL